MVNAMHSRILVTQEYRDSRSALGPETPRRPVNGEVVGRLVSSPPNSKDPNRGRLMLSSKDVKDWCTKNRVDYKSIIAYLKSHDALVSEHEKVRLTRGTDVPGGQTWCIVVDTLKLEDQSSTGVSAVTLAVRNTDVEKVAAVV